MFGLLTPIDSWTLTQRFCFSFQHRGICWLIWTLPWMLKGKKYLNPRQRTGHNHKNGANLLRVSILRHLHPSFLPNSTSDIPRRLSCYEHHKHPPNYSFADTHRTPLSALVILCDYPVIKLPPTTTHRQHPSSYLNNLSSRWRRQRRQSQVRV